MSENSNELLEKLTADIDEAMWELIIPHNERGAVFIVDDSIDLVAVGVAMTKDQVEYIRDWLNSGKLYKPTEDMIKTWTENSTFFKYLIIQPYVLVQVKKEELI